MGKPEAITGAQINWNHVFYFSEVAACGSLKDASVKLNLSPSTLSEHISQLEADLKIALFHRHHRRLELTPEGSKLFQHAKQMFETGMRLIDVVSPLPLGYYPLSIGVVPSSSLPVAYGLIRTFLGNQGGTNVSVSHAGHADLEKGLAEARFDFGFTDRPPERKDLDSQLVVSTELNFYVAAGKGPSGERLADLLAELPLLISTPTTSTRGLVEHYLEEAGIAPRAIIRSDYPSLTLDLCRNGHGVGVFTEEAITSAYGSRDGLREVKGGPRISERLYVVWPKGSENSAALQALRALLR